LFFLLYSLTAIRATSIDRTVAHDTDALTPTPIVARARARARMSRAAVVQSARRADSASSSMRSDADAIETRHGANASRDARHARDAARAIERDDITTVIRVRRSEGRWLATLRLRRYYASSSLLLTNSRASSAWNRSK
jgi:hypothetical protein